LNNEKKESAAAKKRWSDNRFALELVLEELDINYKRVQEELPQETSSYSLSLESYYQLVQEFTWLEDQYDTCCANYNGLAMEHQKQDSG